MFINLLLLLSALSLSSIAGYYSVIGMTAIFASAWWPVVIMTGMLEFSKVVVAAWLHRNWSRTPFLLKSYLAVSVIVLMFITSLGIFGFLSKAHIEQTSGIGNNQLFIAQIDQQIKVEQGRIDDSRRVIQQMDDAVNSLLKASTQQSSARNATVAQQAAKLRQGQAKDRALLNSSIDESNAKIRALNSQKLKLDQEQLKLEVEVGPIKYIAEMIYGNNPDKDLLEKAVRYVIILIIFVFDPLAILMIIAASMSFSGKKKREPEIRPVINDAEDSEKTMSYQQAVGSIRESDQRNGLAWSDHPIVGNPAASVAMQYPQPAAPITPIPPAESSTPAVKEQATIMTEIKVSDQSTISEVTSNTVKVSDAAVSQPIISQELTEPPVPVIDEPAVSQPIIPQELTEPPVPVIDEPAASQPLENGQQDLSSSKPDELLQKIKQYHSVRLEDARRSIR